MPEEMSTAVIDALAPPQEDEAERGDLAPVAVGCAASVEDVTHEIRIVDVLRALGAHAPRIHGPSVEATTARKAGGRN
jgi:hypothetical protein